MAASVIVQQPVYDLLPVGQEIIFTVSNTDAVATETKVKFVVEVHISGEGMPTTANTNHLIGTFKATPNNAGVGIFDMRNIIENFTSADNRSDTKNTGTTGPQFKSVYTTTGVSLMETYPIHIIDKFSRAPNSVRFMVLQFYVEYLGADDGINPPDPDVVARAYGTAVNSDVFSIFNGYVKHSDPLTMFQGNFGFDTIPFAPSDTSKRFLTNAPYREQTANYDDYGTLAFYQPTFTSAGFVHSFDIDYYGSDGIIIDTVNIRKRSVNGAFNTWTEKTEKHILFLGCFPGNLRNWSVPSNIPSAALLEGGYILVSAVKDTGAQSIQPMRININCPETKNFEPIRLAWLNQWGAWDYYTFTKKSTRTFKSKGTTYTQLGGTWNESTYKINSHRGGKKTFRVNSTEQIKINTDLISEDFNDMFEDLSNSPEVYILKGYGYTTVLSALNTYVTPVRITSKNFIRKTRANDRVIQYSFTIEKTKTLRTQSI